jgi:iron complex outermembrane receptor protein
LEFDLTETLELAFALRYDREEREVKNQVPNVDNSGLNINLVDQETFEPLPINPALQSNPDGIPKRDDTYSLTQPKLTLNWAVTDNMNLYASYGVGFRSGGFNSVGTEDLLNFWFNAGYGGPGEAVDAQLRVTDDYDKEVSTAYELGMKSEWWDNRFRFNAAIFQTDVDDNQFFEFFAGPFGLLRSVTTIDELYIRGFEADFSLSATDGLTFYGGIGLLDSEIEKNKNRPLSEGNEVPQAPGETGNLGVEWVLPLGSTMSLMTRLDWQYVGETWFHTLQGEETPTIWEAFGFPNTDQNFSRSARESYSTVDLRIGLEADNWAVTAWGRNLTDEEYLQEVIPAPEFGGSFNHPSALRAYGLDFYYRF